MKRSTRAAGTALVTAGLIAGVAPAATAAPGEHRGWGRGNLVVCVDDLRGRNAEIEVRGRSYREGDTDGGCTVFRRLRTGFYLVKLDAPWGCDDDAARVVIRRNRTAVVHLDADCPRWHRWQRWDRDDRRGGWDRDWGNDDWDDDWDDWDDD